MAQDPGMGAQIDRKLMEICEGLEKYHLQNCVLYHMNMALAQYIEQALLLILRQQCF